MSPIRIDGTPSRAQLAVFGVLWLVSFSVLGAIVLSRGGSVDVVTGVWVVAIVVPAIGWIMPGFMRVVYTGMRIVTFPIGLVLSWLVLGAVYYLVLTPIGLLTRMFGYDSMKRRFDTTAESYWVMRKPDSDLRRYFRQY